jgi:DNA-binding PadR family transcriptional regulator
MATPNDFIPLNPRDYLVLFSLTAGERHGYGIVKEVEEQSVGSVRMDPSNLYRSLKRLIQKGLVVESELRQDRDSEERRRFYSLTPLGDEVVEAEARRLSQLTDAARARELIPGSRRPA